jgi:hypothetical protein
MMHNPLRPFRRTSLVPALLVGCTLTIVLTMSTARLTAQGQTKRLARVTVTDPLNRFVTSLDQESFGVVENGVLRPITDFSSCDSPISLAIVSETPVALDSFSRPERPNDELIQTRSVSDAIQQLLASKNAKKSLIVTTGADTQAVPAGIQVVRSNPEILPKWVVELRNQYLVQFESANASARVEVVLKQPRGLPPLRPHLN